MESWYYSALYAAIPLAALVVDTVYGDPRSNYHPVVLIGNLISFYENKLYPKVKTSNGNMFFRGMLVVLLVLGLSRFPDKMIHGFRVFATVIRSAGTIGIALGAFSYMTGLQLLPGLTPLDEALKVVSSIGIVLLGSLPFAEILQRLLKNPLEWIGEKIGLGRNGTAGLLVGIVSALPVIADMKRMNEREIVMNAALLVCGTSMVAAHLGFVLGVDAPATGALLAGKLTGGIAGVWMAWRIMK